MGRRHVAAATFVCIVGLLGAARAGAQVPDADLSAAEQAYVDLDFERANSLADAFVKRGGLSHAQLVRAYKVLGRSHAILDHDEAARDAFVKLLTYSPSEKPDRDLPPRVTVRMEEARGVLAGYPSQPGIEVTPVLVPGDGGSLRVTTRDPTHVVQKVFVGWRWGTAGEFSTQAPVVGDGIEVPLSSAPPGAARLDYYAGATDDRGDVVFEVGNVAAPKTALVPLPPAPPPPPPSPLFAGPTAGARERSGKSIFASPLFWAVAGAVVVGTGTGMYFVLRKPQSETLGPTGASLTPVLFCGVNRCQ
jgi:hypothetical protein